MDDDLKASVLVLVLGVIGLVLLLSIADSQRNTAEVLNRRSPVLENCPALPTPGNGG